MNSSVEPDGTVALKFLHLNVRSAAAAVAAALVALSPLTAGAKTFDNTAGTFVYGTATNWSDDLVPTSADPVVFDNSGTTLTGTTVVVGASAAADSWTFGSAGGTALGAFAINATAARAITLGSGAITVDSSVTGQQSIANAAGTFTFTSSTGAVTVTNNSTQTLLLQNVTYAAGTNLTFAPSGGAIISSATASPTIASLNGGYSNVTIDRTGTGSSRTLTIGGGTGAHTFAGTIINGTVANPATSNSLSVTINGADSTFSQTLTGTNTYNGTTTVTQGTLIVAAGGSITSQPTVNGGRLIVNGTVSESGNVSVTSGTIGGSGSIFRTANVVRAMTMSAGAKLSPGASTGIAGTFSVLWNAATTSSIDLTAASNDTGAFVFDLATPSTSDKFVVTTGTDQFKVGQLDFADFAFNALAGFGEGTYTLFDGNATATGSLHSLVGTIGTASGTIAGYNAVLSIDTANDDVILTVTSVPEPTIVGLLGTAAIGLMARRRQTNPVAV